MKSVMSRKEEVSTKQGKIAINAKRLPEVSFTSIAYHMDFNWLAEAYMRTRKDSACGIDGVTGKEYEKELESNLNNLLTRAKTGRYFAPPVKRVYIPKGNGKELRPLGLPTFEDKILQRSILMLIEPIFEQDFYDFSYGFRPGKSQHQALERLWKEAMNTNGWIIDIDIRKYFDSINHGKLREIYKPRVKDGLVTRLLGKWLKAGIMEEGKLFYNEQGTPQSGVVSPMLSNIFLHEILDKWYVKTVKQRLNGKSFLIRFADDAVMGFSNKNDANRVMKVIGKRFEKYGLMLHPEKTKMIKFQDPTKAKFKLDNEENDSFDFLGFTHYWGKSRKGNYIVRRKTSKKKFTASLKTVKEWCKANRHMKVKDLIKDLNNKLIGYYGYYGITLNIDSLKSYYECVCKTLYKWLNRRNRNKGIDGNKFQNILNRFPLVKPRIVHSFI